MRTILFTALAGLFLSNAATAQSKTAPAPSAVTTVQATDPLMEEKRALSGELKEKLSMVEAYMGKARSIKAEASAEQTPKVEAVAGRLDTLRAQLMEQLNLVNAATAANSQEVFAKARETAATVSPALEAAKSDLTGGSK